MKYLKDLPKERQLRMFPEFLNWLEKEGNVWSSMESKGVSAVGKKSSSKSSTTLLTKDRTKIGYDIKLGNVSKT